MVEWDESLSVGIEKIDEQHRNLFGLINRLEGLDEAPSAETEVIVDALLDYAQIHFQTEEEFFYRYNYLDKEAHEKEHGAFVTRAVEYFKQFEQQKNINIPEVHAFLIDWLTNHIKGSDMKFKGMFTE
ncbi:MAG: hypothetical protein C0624_12870 [Desulfuromonas sp.]|nr:MAG: hypothetical protein C0624_12870 [Desulfuromonas sp.]